MFTIVILQLLSLFCLSLSMDKHFKALFNKRNKPKYVRALTVMGWLGLCLSFYNVDNASLPVSIMLVYSLLTLSLAIIGLALFYGFLIAKVQIKSK